jgi:hypothetical protein
LPQLVFGYRYLLPLYSRCSGLFPMGVAQAEAPEDLS